MEDLYTIYYILYIPYPYPQKMWLAVHTTWGKHIGAKFDIFLKTSDTLIWTYDELRETWTSKVFPFLQYKANLRFKYLKNFI